MLGWARDYLSGPAPWATFAVLAALAVAVHRPVARRAGWPPRATVGLLVSLAAVAAITLPSGPGAAVTGPAWSALPGCWDTLFDPVGTGWELSAGSRGERLANTVMFLPVGCFAVLATGRAAAPLLAAVLLPVPVELVQAVAGAGRLCAGADWATNGLGAFLGGLVGWLLVRWRRDPAPGDGPPR